MTRVKQPTKNLTRVKKLRVRINKYIVSRDRYLAGGLIFTAANDQKVIDSLTMHLETEIGGSPKQ